LALLNYGTLVDGLLYVGIDPNKPTSGPEVESGRFYLASSTRRRM